MKVIFDPEGTYAGLQDAIEKLSQNEEIESLLVFVCDKNGFEPQALDPLLARAPLPIFGGCFPGILYQQQFQEQGSIVIGIAVEPKIQLIEGLSEDKPNFDETIDSSIFESLNGGVMFVLVDGMSTNVNSFLESVFNEIGMVTGYIGGGAGSLEFVQKPCLFTNKGLKKDCSILAHLDIENGIGGAHGMRTIEGPYKVTGSSHNIVKTIDWQPAASFFKELIFNHPEYDSNLLGVMGTDAHYSLGLNRYDAERIIIEPIKEEADQSLVFMAEVREGEFLDIMHVTADSMIDSASSALNRALDTFKGPQRPQTLISFDCISRKIFLKERFEEELKAICKADIPHVGVLTFGGEIGTSGKDFLDYHNRTCVIGVFGD
ncbi:MAG: FIST C-terminal domain-containing protein [SAR324 cluster bacterium]|nr:FIST C-terminal domain-containing protein [SAR324 cluster bacterium]